MKSLNSFVELYKPKSPDEQRFVDKHVVKTRGDANGNGDDVFKGSKVKKVERTKERKGYEPGDDEKVYEEVEGIHELSVDTLRSYRAKAKGDAEKISFDDEGADRRMRKRSMGSWDAGKKILKKGAPLRKEEIDFDLFESIMLGEGDLSIRALYNKYADHALGAGDSPQPKKAAAVKKAITKVHGSTVMGHLEKAKNAAAKNDQDSESHHFNAARNSAKTDTMSATVGKNRSSMRKEEIEQVEEKMDMKTADMGDVITDFQKSDAPQFKGKTKAQRRVMAIAAKLSEERGDKPLSEHDDTLENLIADLRESNQRVMLSVFNKLTEENQEKFLTACKVEGGVDAMLDFSIKHRNVE